MPCVVDGPVFDDLRAAATLRSLSRIRSELEQLPETFGLSDPMVLNAQDVVLLERQLMSLLRWRNDRYVNDKTAHWQEPPIPL